MDEIWRPVVGYERYYEVSNLGRVRGVTRVVATRIRGAAACRTIQGRLKAEQVDKDGYRSVRLYRDGIGLWLRVARLVLSAFHGPSGPGDEACHVDHDPANNSATNLRWGSRASNERDKTGAGRRPTSTVGKLTRDDAEKIREAYASGTSPRQLAAHYSTHLSNVYLIIRGKTWVHGRTAH